MFEIIFYSAILITVIIIIATLITWSKSGLNRFQDIGKNNANAMREAIKIREEMLQVQKEILEEIKTLKNSKE
ncbi:uncharacterized protein YybS (DUF2232 family) [Gracilibacillus halotolerans]|uniref:Uncharacterized protein YybS (DUF2232 family) n=1 Tax=Gracilibacillus halotolerans TaxID=74386 RepID=A0A841RLN8_9BACI|nr:hypothetical protein [Gracilibacillus halotolerans]MBB6511864.1 uncharacterized protein YybS (DUF2232 family) [Gracilibacillus halotolerans]